MTKNSLCYIDIKNKIIKKNLKNILSKLIIKIKIPNKKNELNNLFFKLSNIKYHQNFD